MVIDKIYKMTVKGIKSKSESFFSISHSVLELWKKNLRGEADPPPSQDRVKKKRYLVSLILLGEPIGSKFDTNTKAIDFKQKKP